ncbi:S8 family peptidase [Tenacibaculum sp. nBUS_03]|uniref:S8 family peptidase n=1 Tax=Tenacibaculum sp. nBUS_03 TaxID=3395320 RepID=UPI003EB837A0
MKLLKLLFVLTLSLAFVKCSVDDTELTESYEKLRLFKTKKTILQTPRYSKNELIIKFRKGISDRKKHTLRNRYKVVKYQFCDLCDDKLIEKWSFGNDADVEDKKLTIQGGSGEPEGDITNVDNEFIFHLENENNSEILNTHNNGFASQIVPNNSGVTVGVLDTGVNANYPLFVSPFLYNSSGVNVASELSGWDFVNHDNDFYDDYELIHGTKVTYIVNNKLNEDGIPHQILPVKVCDENGVASYFNILCGLKYALPRVHIIQMSLGWYNNNVYVNSIFNDLVTEYNNVLIVTSAGNAGVDNDNVSHYPSSYPQANILAIAASNTENSNIAYFSNYGANTVDFYAPGQNIKFYDISGSLVYISGTSYAAPLVTAISAKVLYDSGMLHSPNQIIDVLNTLGVNQSYSRPVKYNKLLN